MKHVARITAVTVLSGLLLISNYRLYISRISNHRHMDKNTVLTSRLTRDGDSTLTCTQSIRLAILRKACVQWNWELGVVPDRRYIEHLLVDDKHRFVFCDVAKAGSTAWLKLLVEASGQIGSRHVSLEGIHVSTVLEKFGLKRLRTFNNTEIEHILKTYFKFIVVRHPFDRLVSAWKDKFIMPDGPFLDLSAQIAQRYQSDRNRFNRSSKTDSYWDNRAHFTEFARHLLKTNMENDHWNSFSEVCHPCAVIWDAIIKLETANHDAGVVIRHLGVNVTSLPVVHSHQNRSALYDTDKVLTEFQGMRPDALQYLYQRYGADMSMFGYSWDQRSLTSKCGQNNVSQTCC